MPKTAPNRYARAMVLLEAGGWAPVNWAIGIAVFVILLILMSIVHGVGASRPHS